jgi:uncharacterized membrane protein YqjE
MCNRNRFAHLEVKKMSDHELKNGRSFAAIVADMKEDLKEFAQTRIEMFKREVQEKLARLKIAGPLAGAALVLVLTAYLLITIALAASVAAFLPTNPFRWAIGFGAVGLLWALLGAAAAYMAKRELEPKTLAPNRTVSVLKGDKIWLQKEVKNGYEHANRELGTEGTRAA